MFHRKRSYGLRRRSTVCLRLVLVTMVAAGATGCGGEIRQGKATPSSPPKPASPRSTSPATVSAIDYTEGQHILLNINDAFPVQPAVSDFNGDGKFDIATGSESGPFVWVLLGKGDGTFGEPSSIPAGRTIASISAADLDGDGRIDLATSNHDGTVTVLWGKGDGSFRKPVSYGVKGDIADGIAWSVTPADLNGDESLDLVVTVSPYGPGEIFRPAPRGHVSVLLGTDGRGFGEPVHHEDPIAAAAVAGDFDGDGKTDVATANFDGTVRVFGGDGNGRLGPAAEYPIDGQGVAMAAGDFDGDGVLDLATGNDRSFNVSVLPGLGDGTFEASLPFDAGNTHAVAVVDLDGDGYLDLIAGGYDETFIRFWPGRGDGTFLGEARIHTGGPGALRVAVADFDGNGRLDFAVLGSELTSFGTPGTGLQVLLAN